MSATVPLLDLATVAIEEYERDPVFRSAVDIGVEGSVSLIEAENPNATVTDHQREDMRMAASLAIASSRLVLLRPPKEPNPFWLGYQGVPWK